MSNNAAAAIREAAKNARRASHYYTQASDESELTYKSASLTYKAMPAVAAITAESSGLIRAVVNSTEQRDRQDDVVHAGAWRKVIASGKLPKILYHHSWDNLPVGKAIALQECGFASQKSGEHFRDGVRHVMVIDELPEVSGVIVGASMATQTLSVKSAATAELPEEVRGLIEGIVAEEVTDAILRSAAPLTPEDKTGRSAPFLWGPRALGARGHPGGGLIRRFVNVELERLEKTVDVRPGFHRSQHDPNPRGAAIR